MPFLPTALKIFSAMNAVSNNNNTGGGMPDIGWDFISKNALKSGIRFPPFGQDLVKSTFEQLNKQTAMTPQELAGYIRDLSSPMRGARDSSVRRSISDFAGRGMLFGGSVTGAEAMADASYEEELGKLSSQLGLQNRELGFQGQQSARQMLFALLNQIIGGQFGVQGAAAGIPRQKFLGIF